MDLLTAVNRIMPKLGEHPVTSLDRKHPTLAILLPIIDTKVEDLSMQGQWFNTFTTTLYPDREGGIAMPVGTLAFTPTYVEAVVRGKRLMDPLTMAYIWKTPVEGTLITRVPFEELPESVAGLVWYSALVDAYITDVGMETNVQAWMQQAQLAQARVLSEHLRNKKYSTKRSPRFSRLRAAMRA